MNNESIKLWKWHFVELVHQHWISDWLWGSWIFFEVLKVHFVICDINEVMIFSFISE